MSGNTLLWCKKHEKKVKEDYSCHDFTTLVYRHQVSPVCARCLHSRDLEAYKSFLKNLLRQYLAELPDSGLTELHQMIKREKERRLGEYLEELKRRA
ncbi:hypothetical protein [Candidatus Pyrohabitans sp.]